MTREGKLPRKHELVGLCGQLCLAANEVQALAVRMEGMGCLMWEHRLVEAARQIDMVHGELESRILELHPDLAITRRLIAGEKAHVPSGPG